MQVLAGKVNITVSLPSGTSCLIAIPPDSRVEHLQPSIERSLKIARCVQRIIAGTGDDARVLAGHQTLRQVGLGNGGSVTVARTWPEGEDAIVAAVEVLSSSKSNHTELVAEAVAELLDRESPRIRIAAIQGLSWMGPCGAVHADKIGHIMLGGF